MGAGAKSLPHAYSILCAYKLERKQPNNDGEIYEHLILMMNPVKKFVSRFEDNSSRRVISVL